MNETFLFCIALAALVIGVAAVRSKTGRAMGVAYGVAVIAVIALLAWLLGQLGTQVFG